ncbi:MAG: ABC transporter ATP-binding protein [Anaerocolumna sp.]
MLCLDDVRKYYKNKKAVDGISFKIQKGEIFGLVGANGAGKSTTISMLTTMIKPDSGDILYRGQSIVKDPKIIRGQLGYVPQDIALYSSLSGRDNLLFWGNAYHVPKNSLDKRIKEVSDIIGFTEDILNQKTAVYSGGMKRRLNLGAALLHRPEFLVLDEPTVGIDMIARNQILDSIKKLNDVGTTILYCGHYMDEVERICDSFCILDKGRKIVCGNKTTLLNEPNKTLESLYYELVGTK